jgi:hypothetical protein
MEIKILNSILFKELMPWTFDAKGTKAITEKVKKVGSKEPITEAELVQQLQILLADYSDLSKWLTKQNTKGTSTLKNHCYAIDFPAYSDALSKFYNAVISLETLRVYNAFNTKMQKYSKKVDIVYHTTIALKNIKALTVNTVKEIKERGFEEAPTEQSSLPHFALQLLRQHLTILFFDIQELRKGSIDSPTSIEDFYLLDLNLPKAQISELQKVEIETEKTEKPTTKEKLSFANDEELKVLNSKIEEIELSLRHFIVENFQINSTNDFKNIVPSHIQEKIKGNIEKEEKKNPALVKSRNNSPEYLLQFSDLQELQGIIVAKNNWEIVQEVFGTKENLAIEFNNLSGLRNPIRHSREIDEVSLLKGKAAISWFKQQLNIQ